MWTRLMPLALIPGLALCGALARFAENNMAEVRASFRAEEIMAAKESIALSLMGQLQLTAQSLVWMKTLEYLHNGVAFRMPTNAEEASGFRAQNSVGMANGLEHAEGVPLALNKELDWRGRVGELHRTVLPHMAVHNHSDPVELIPWYELALRLNPNIERLYSMGAFFMADFAREPRRALALLENGVEANPWSYEIRGALGRLLFEYHRELDIEPDEAYERAARILREGADLGKRERERLEAEKDHFDDYEKQIFRESYLFLARSLTELGRYDEATAACEEGYDATGHNHMNVQKRIVAKLMSGERPDEESPSSDRHGSDPRDSGSSDKPEEVDVDADTGPTLPISVVLGIPSPEHHGPLTERPELRDVLQDVRDHPYDSVATRFARLGGERDDIVRDLRELVEQRFVSQETAATSDEIRHYLTPIGLYILRGEYGFDFWKQMASEAKTLEEQGVHVNLSQGTVERKGVHR